MANKIQVQFIDNDGEGDVRMVEVDEGTTAAMFFSAMKGSADASDYTIRVNRLGADPNQVLRADDRFTLTPAKVEGANL